MQVAKDSVVSVHYKLTLDSGEVVDSSVEHGNPLVFIAGHGHIIPGLETSLMGLKAGDKKEVTVVPEEGYGVRNEDLIQTVPRDQFPADIELRVFLYPVRTNMVNRSK